MQLQIFKYEEKENHYNNLTTIEIEGEPWFVASEVCKLLGIQNTSQALESLDEDEKSTVSITDGTSGNPNKLIVSESGLYGLIFRSTKPEAKKFRKWITKEVIPAIRKSGSYGINRLHSPNFVVRFNINWDKTDRGYFSVIGELFIRLYGKFEHLGYQIPNEALDGKEMRPDNSVGKLFAKYLRDQHPERANDYKMYPHLFMDDSVHQARQYKNDLLPIFIYFVDNVWIPERAQSYFEQRDPVALDYLPKLLGYDPNPSKFNKSLNSALNFNPKTKTKD